MHSLKIAFLRQNTLRCCNRKYSAYWFIRACFISVSYLRSCHPPSSSCSWQKSVLAVNTMILFINQHKHPFWTTKHHKCLYGKLQAAKRANQNYEDLEKQEHGSSTTREKVTGGVSKTSMCCASSNSSGGTATKCRNYCLCGGLTCQKRH